MRTIPLVHLNFPHLHDNKEIHLHNNNMYTYTDGQAHDAQMDMGDTQTHNQIATETQQPHRHRDTTATQAQRQTATQAQRHRVAGTNEPTVPVHIKSSTNVVPVTYRHGDIELLVPVYQQYQQYQYIFVGLMRTLMFMKIFLASIFQNEQQQMTLCSLLKMFF